MTSFDTNKTNEFLLLYGSQTGQAQAIAEELKLKCEINQGLLVDLNCMSTVNKTFNFERQRVIVIVISTTGDGEYPDTASKLVRLLKKRILPKDYLSNLRYALLALGDSNYSSFCQAGRNFDKRLKELGAKSFLPTVFADDAVGLEIVAEPWMIDVLSSVRRELNLPPVIIQPSPEMSTMDNIDLSNIEEAFNDINLLTPNLPKQFLKISYSDEKIDSPKHPHDNFFLPSSVSDIMSTTILSLKKFTNSEKVKEIFELTLKVHEDVTYEPGDSFGILCSNHEPEVKEIFQHLGIDREKANQTCQLVSIEENKLVPAHLMKKSRLDHLLSKCCEIRTTPKKAFVRSLAEYAESKDEKRRLLILSSRQGSAYYTKFVREGKMCLLDFFKKFKSCKPPIETLLENFPALQPRFYSVTCSPLTSPQEISVLFSLAKLDGSKCTVERNGVCTGYFKNLHSSKISRSKEQDLTQLLSTLSLDDQLKIPIYKRSNSSFKLPNSLTIPIIMVGPGTGVGPFLGFLKHRQKQLAALNLDSRSLVGIGETWLFYGCRYKNLDYPFKMELEEFNSTKVLDHLCVSFSREENEAKYVQDNIRKHASKLIALLERGAVIYVCGDAKNMAKDVSQTFKECYKIEKDCKNSEADDFFKTITEKKQYRQDIWA